MDYEEQNEQELDIFILLGDFLKISKRFWILLILLVMLCSTGLTFFQRGTYHPTYEAYASFTVHVANPLYSSVEGYNSKTAEVMAATFPSIVSSSILQKRVMDDLHVSSLPEISVSAMSGAGIITIHVRNSSQIPLFMLQFPLLFVCSGIFCDVYASRCFLRGCPFLFDLLQISQNLMEANLFLH